MLGFENFPEYEVPGVRQVQFYPYESNGGYVFRVQSFCCQRTGHNLAAAQ